jgi:hypothetical protein
VVGMMSNVVVRQKIGISPNCVERQCATL